MTKALIKNPSVFLDSIFVCLIVGAAAIASFPFLEYGAPSGHSISYNLAWLANFSSQLLQGDLYPRWLSNMNHGEGSPVFFFYAPLPFYISSLGVLLFHASKIGIQLAAGEWLLLALSGATFYLFVRQRVSPLPALIGAVLYMLLPYHFEIDLWRRQAIGELANYIWMPLILYFVDKQCSEHRGIVGLAISYSLLIFSHLPTALLFSPFIAVYALVLYSENQSKGFLKNIAYSLFLGVLLSGIYLVPALFTQQYISTEKLWNAHFDYHGWFLPINGLNRSAFTDRLFSVLCFTTLMFAICGLAAYRHRNYFRLNFILPWLLFAGLTWFLMSSLSTALWEMTPFLWKVQFPWRVAIVLDLTTAIMVTFTVQHAFATRSSLSYLIVCVVCLLLIYCSYTGRTVIGNLDPLEDSHYISYRDNEVRAGHDAPEYTTVWTSLATHGKSGDSTGWLKKLRYDNSQGQVQIHEWKPREILLDVDLKQGTELTIRQFYFPGWHAHIVGDARELDVKPGKSIGLVRVVAPSGRYQLLLEMQPLWQEIAGEVVSGLGLLGILFCWRNGRRKNTLAEIAHARFSSIAR